MAFGELMIAFGRVASTALQGAANSILADLRVLEDEEGAPAEFDSSALEALLLPPGFYCRPLSPDYAATAVETPGECEVVALRVGDELVPVGYRDLRIAAKVNPDEGELGIAGYGGGFLSLKLTPGGDGTAVVLYSPRGSSGAHVLSMDPDASNSHIVLLHEAGQSVTLNKDGKVVIVSPDGANILEVGDDSVKLNGAEVRMVGSVVLGTETNPAADPSVQALVKETNFAAWRAQVDAALLALSTHTHAAGALVDSTPAPCTGATAAVAGVTPPSIAPEYTDNVVAK